MLIVASGMNIQDIDVAPVADMAAAAVTNIFESNAPLQGARATETAHRRIELQSPEVRTSAMLSRKTRQLAGGILTLESQDLTYMIANATRAARQKLDRDLPPDATPEQEDAKRRRVEEIVDDVCLCLAIGSDDATNRMASSTFARPSLMLRATSLSTAWTLRS